MYIKDDRKEHEYIVGIMEPITDLIEDVRKEGYFSTCITIKSSNPLAFKFGCILYGYFNVLFEYKNEKLTWKAISCNEKQEIITNGIEYNPFDSEKIVDDVEKALEPYFPEKYLTAICGKNYKSFTERTDFITVKSKKEFNALKHADENDNFKTTDEALDFMLKKTKELFGSDAENFKIIDNYDYQGWHIRFSFTAYKMFNVEVYKELADGALIRASKDDFIFVIPMSANDFCRLTADEFLAQLKENLELRR